MADCGELCHVDFLGRKAAEKSFEAAAVPAPCDLFLEPQTRLAPLEQGELERR